LFIKATDLFIATIYKLKGGVSMQRTLQKYQPRNIQNFEVFVKKNLENLWIGGLRFESCVLRYES